MASSSFTPCATQCSPWGRFQMTGPNLPTVCEIRKMPMYCPGPRLVTWNMGHSYLCQGLSPHCGRGCIRHHRLQTGPTHTELRPCSSACGPRACNAATTRKLVRNQTLRPQARSTGPEHARLGCTRVQAGNKPNRRNLGALLTPQIGPPRRLSSRL